MTLEARLKRLEQQHTVSDDYFSQFRGMTFEQFWEAIGRPEKPGTTGEIYPYEQTILEALVSKKLIWIKKATGLGITEFFLRWIAWKAINDDSWKGTEDAQVVIITGQNWETAKGLMRRLKALFPAHLWTEKETVAIINDCRIQTFPSDHLDAARSLKHPHFILLDEADFFSPGEQANARTVSERYIAKSNPYIVMISTPGDPDGLFDRMEREHPSIYHKIFLHYEVGKGYVYTDEDLEQAQKTPDFKREYELMYGYGMGNVWRPEQIEACTKIKYNPSEYIPALHIMGVDPAWGSSKFGFVVARLADSKIQIVVAEEYEHADMMVMPKTGADLITKYRISKVYIDGANPGYIRTLKALISERTDYDKAMEEYKRQKIDYQKVMRIVPVMFSQENKEMLTHAQELVSNGMVAIDKQFDSLLTQMRSAQVKETGKLDKEDGKGATYDLVDSFFLACKGFEWRGRNT